MFARYKRCKNSGVSGPGDGPEGEAVYVSPHPKSTRTLLSELCSDFRESCLERQGELMLDANSITSPTFKWCLTTMGISCLSILIADTIADISYQEDIAELRVTGQCLPYEGWEGVLYTVTISTGNAENTVLYANTKIEAVYDTFSLPLVTKSKMIPPDAVEAKALPQYMFNNVPMSVISTSTSTLPNCVQRFGVSDMIGITPHWTINEPLHLVTDSLGFMINNLLNKGGVVVRSFLIYGRVTFGSNFFIPVTVAASVDYFSQKDIWNITITDKQRPLIDVDGLSCRAGPINLLATFPPTLLALTGGYALQYYHVQYNPDSHIVYKLDMNASAPVWEVVPNELIIHDTTFGITVYNPFSIPDNKNISVHILGKCSVAACNFEQPWLDIGATISGEGEGGGQGEGQWCFEISGELSGNTDDEYEQAKICVDFSGSDGAVIIL
jgi:hypothetical protein